MAVMQAYFDESGKWKDQKVVSFCGVSATQPKIQQLDKDWRSLLRRYGMPALHMKEAFRLKRPLGKNVKAQTIPERIEALKPFADVIREHMEIGIVVAVDVGAYKQMSHEAKRRLGGSDDPHYMAFMTAIMAPVKQLHNDDRLSLVCDDDEATALNSYHFYRRIRKLSREAHTKLVAMSFAHDTEFPPLQAADFIAALARLQAIRMFFNRPYDYHPLFHYMIGNPTPHNALWALSFWGKDKLAGLAPKLESRPLGSKVVAMR
jgi:hypothetical protein